MMEPSKLPEVVVFTSLPEQVMQEILEYVCVTEHRIVLSLCKSLWSIRRTIEGNVKTLQLTPRDCFAKMLAQTPTPLSNFDNLQQLDVGDQATDAFFSLLSPSSATQTSLVLPNLRSLSMVGSLGITDDGLEQLSLRKERCQLNTIDITFCGNTTYGGTFAFREHLPNLKLLQRIPKWLQGHFYTPFGTSNTEGQPEIHTYWPDGTFTFNRDSQSNGFVCELFCYDNTNDFVGDKLQYNNFVAPLGWPEWTQYCYRPGVSLLKMDPEVDPSSGQLVQCVLVSTFNAGNSFTRLQVL